MIRSRVCALRLVRGVLLRLSGLTHRIAAAARIDAIVPASYPASVEHLIRVLAIPGRTTTEGRRRSQRDGSETRFARWVSPRPHRSGCRDCAPADARMSRPGPAPARRRHRVRSNASRHCARDLVRSTAWTAAIVCSPSVPFCEAACRQRRGDRSHSTNARQNFGSRAPTARNPSAQAIDPVTGIAAGEHPVARLRRRPVAKRWDACTPAQLIRPSTIEMSQC